MYLHMYKSNYFVFVLGYSENDNTIAVQQRKKIRSKNLTFSHIDTNTTVRAVPMNENRLLEHSTINCFRWPFETHFGVRRASK